MCLIIFGKQDKKPSFNLLKKAWETNGDGAGIGYYKNKKAHFKKGLNLQETYDFVQKLDAPEYIIHLRLTSFGGNSPLLTHPFIISEDSPLSLEGKADRIIFHNGTVENFDYLLYGAGIFPDEKEIINDSRAIAMVLSKQKNYNLLYKLRAKYNPNKFAIIDGTKEKFYAAGDFYQDDDHKGFWFSNTIWKYTTQYIQCGFEYQGNGKYHKNYTKKEKKHYGSENKRYLEYWKNLFPKNADVIEGEIIPTYLLNEKNEIEVNTWEHMKECCVVHGCKFNDEYCPVVNASREQNWPCEKCNHEKIYTLEQLRLVVKEKTNKELQKELEEVLEPKPYKLRITCYGNKYDVTSEDSDGYWTKDELQCSQYFTHEECTLVEKIYEEEKDEELLGKTRIKFKGQFCEAVAKDKLGYWVKIPGNKIPIYLMNDECEQIEVDFIEGKEEKKVGKKILYCNSEFEVLDEHPAVSCLGLSPGYLLKDNYNCQFWARKKLCVEIDMNKRNSGGFKGKVKRLLGYKGD